MTEKKKKPTKRASRKKPKKFEPMVDPDGSKYFTREDLLSYSLLEQKYLNLRLMRAAKDRERLDISARLDHEAAALKKSERRSREDLFSKRVELDEKYDVHMFSSDFTYDDETGRIISKGTPPEIPADDQT